MATEISSIARRWKRYPAYKPSGVEWLGEVPEGWNSKRLKFTVDLITEKIDATKIEMPYTGLENIESWTGRYISSETPPEVEGQSNYFRPGDILFGKLRPYLAKVFKANDEGICTSELLVLHPKLVNQNFLFYYLISRDFITNVDSSTYGAKMPRASWDYIGNLFSLIPSHSEQLAIASFLDRETARIDALIEKKERQIELLKEKRAAIISHAVTKGLDPAVMMKDSGVEWLGVVPEKWEVIKFKNIATIKEGQIDPENAKYQKMTLIAPNHIESGTGRILFTETAEEQGAESGKYLFDNDDVLYSKIRPHLVKACFPKYSGLCSADIYPLRPKKNVTGEFLLSLLISQYFTDYATQESMRVAMPKINRDSLFDCIIVLPPLKDQQKICEYLDQEKEGINKTIEKITESIIKLREFRSALISAAVTGKIDVRETVQG